MRKNRTLVRKACVRTGLVVCVVAVAAGLSGCAMDNIDFPRVSELTDGVRKVLSPEEQDRAIKEMALEQTVHRNAAISDIENR